MRLHRLSEREAGGHTTFGCVWDKGEVKENNFQLINEQGEQIAVQSSVMAYWPDGSIKWSAHSANSDKMREYVELRPVMGDTSGEGGTETLEGKDSQEQVSERLQVLKRKNYYQVDTGELSLKIPDTEVVHTHNLAYDVKRKEVLLVKCIYPVFQLEQWEDGKTQEFHGEITEVSLEQGGPLQAVFCFKGNHVSGKEAKMPFVIRMYLWSGSDEIRFVHTFFYDGLEKRDFLKGMGIRLETAVKGAAYNHHVQFAVDGPEFHEMAVSLASRIPRLEPVLMQRQLAGEMCHYGEDSDEEQAVKELPVWSRYSLCQDSAWHYSIRKQIRKECCEITCREGHRAQGAMAVTGENGGFMLGIRDFWQKYPSGLEVIGLGQEYCQCTAWFYSPEAAAFDFRHYSTESYPRTNYEGFDNVGASAYGISVTSECSVRFTGRVPFGQQLSAYAKKVQKPCVYIGEPEYYYEKRAFGYWSLPQRGTEAEKWFEEQLDKAFAFYKEEIESRSWYGLFDYGDVMHTYDSLRHTWKYDVGGYAWQNTELVPTYWLWLYFLRSGREDVFTMAEAMTRHCSEVDVYHFGPLKGLGSRHNVRHWGCSCKEPRISMAGHNRFLFYLTGDLRLGDIMEDVKDADRTMAKQPYCRETQPDGTVLAGVRSGPDWSSYVSNWMTAYERTLDETYRQRIETGIRDIANTPFGLASGPDYYYDVDTAHLIYRGESETTPNQHLQICMGGPQVWLETADMLGIDALRKFLVDLGDFYFLPKEKKEELTDGKIVNRPFNCPMLACTVTGYAASKLQKKELADQTWQMLRDNLNRFCGTGGFEPKVYAVGDDGREYKEIPGISTNDAAQWCLNVIMCLEFIKEYMPKTL